MNRRGFFGRLFGLAAAPVAAEAVKEEPKAEPIPMTMFSYTSNLLATDNFDWKVSVQGLDQGKAPLALDP